MRLNARPLSIRLVWDIIKAEADFSGLYVADIIGPSRKSWIVMARQAAMYRAYTETGLGRPTLARIFKRDVQTIWHGINAHERHQREAEMSL